MDEQYAYQVADLMEWPYVKVRIPSTPSASAVPAASSETDGVSPSANRPPQLSTRPNNPGYLYFTFSSPADAASVFAQLHSANADQSRAGLAPVRLPNSERMMELNYASKSDSLDCWNYHHHATEPTATTHLDHDPGSLAVERSLQSPVPVPHGMNRSSDSPRATLSSSPRVTIDVSAMGSHPSPGPGSSVPSSSPTQASTPRAGGGSAGEYSIFVGDLAPDVTHADIVAVFRDPTKGLRPDRGPPRKIKPFLSCKMAKIMVDQNTGLSRGYGFVRFTDEADQRRALIEMQGLYCLSRPSEYL